MRRWTPIRRGIAALGMPLRSLEIELGPSQCEFTFRPQSGLDAADTMILFRAAAKQIARRHGLLASFMCRPALPNLFSSRLASAPVADRAEAQAQRLCRRRARRSVARSGCIFSAACWRTRTRRPPSPRRPSTATSATGPMRSRPTARSGRATIAASWCGVLGQPGDPSTHLENRVGEPAANPYLYMASQIYAGLDGIAQRRDPGPSADTPYETKAPTLPKNLGEAVAALRNSDVFAQGFGDAFVDYFARIKEAEFARFKSEAGDTATGDVTAWEQNEYFDLF